MKNAFKTKRIRNTLLVILAGGVLLFSMVVIFTFSTIHRQVEEITMIAVNEYRVGAIESLTNLIKSDHHSFEEKNSAVWALGQFADQRALPFLEELNSQTGGNNPYNRSTGLSKYEIEKAIKWCRHGNLTSWMYRNIEK